MAPPQILPPADSDPSQSRLTFADDYFLGVIDLIFPIRTNCARSPDGTRIVISQWPHSPARFSNSLVWHDINDLRPTELTIPETLITRLVFSPDNRYIAAAGINQNTGKSKLYLLDTETGDKEFLPEIKDVWSLAWVPDGRQLATLNWPCFRMYTQLTLRIYVYDLE